MTREELEHIHSTTLHMEETPQRATLKSYVFRLKEALEAAWEARIEDSASYRAELARLRERIEALEKEREPGGTR